MSSAFAATLIFGPRRSTNWYEHGQKSLEVTFRDGEPEGLETQWHENGQTASQSTYSNGTSTSVTEWDANGTQITR